MNPNTRSPTYAPWRKQSPQQPALESSVLPPLETCAAPSRGLKHTLAGALRALCLLAWMVGGLLLELTLFPWLPWGPVRRRLIQGWHRGVLRILRINVTVIGDLAPQQTIVCANHISWLDIVVIGSALPACFVSKMEVKAWPLIGRLATLAGTIYVDRAGKNLSAVQQAMRRCLREHNTLVFFPEGTTSAGETLRPFKATLFRVAVLEGIPVQPLHLAFGHTPDEQRAAAYIDDDHFVRHLWCRLKAKPLAVHLTALPIRVPMVRGVFLAGDGSPTESHTLKAIARDMAEDAWSAINRVHQSPTNPAHETAPTAVHPS